MQAFGAAVRMKSCALDLQHRGAHQPRIDRDEERASAAPGSTRCRGRSSEIAHPVSPDADVMLPPLGSQPSLTENSTIAIRPTQKPGIE